MGIASKLARVIAKKVIKKKPTKKVIKKKPTKKVIKKKPIIDYVTVPKKAYVDEEKYENMMSKGIKLTDAQLKAYSKAIKLTVDNMSEIDGRQYVTRNIRDNVKGTIEHALDEMDFLPKKYRDLYKKK